MLNIKKTLSLVATVAVLTACGGGGGTGAKSNSGSASSFDPNSYPTYSLSEDNKNDLAFMGNEERLAYNVYTYLYDYHDESITQLQNIANNSERYHIQIVRDLVNKYNITEDDLTILDLGAVASALTEQDSLPSNEYGIKAIQELYDLLIAKGEKSDQDALEVGCMVEVTDINDLNEKIENAEISGAQDLIDGFNILRDGSYNHYWAFDKGLKNMGIDDGCCSLGDDWCHPEYPQNTNM